MLKIRSKSALIKSLLFEFKFDKPTVDRLLVAVPERTLIKACNYVRRYKPYDLVWLKAKIKEYNKPTLPTRAPETEPPGIPEARFREIKKELDQRLNYLK